MPHVPDPSTTFAAASEPADGRIFNQMSRWLLWPVALTVVVIIVYSFIISFQSQVDLAVAARIRPEVAYGWPIIVDGTIIVSTFAAFILQPRGFRVTWYPWLNLILGGSLSIWANGSHATNATPTVWEMFIVGAVPPAALLLSTHMLIIMLGHKPTVVAPVAVPAAAVPAATPAAGPAARPVVEAVIDRPTPPVEVDQPAILHAVPSPVPSLEPAHRPQVSDTPAPTRTTREPKNPTATSVVSRLTRAQAADRIRDLLASGSTVTAEEVGEWMGSTAARGQVVIDQVNQEGAA